MQLTPFHFALCFFVASILSVSAQKFFVEEPMESHPLQERKAQLAFPNRIFTQDALTEVKEILAISGDYDFKLLDEAKSKATQYKHYQLTYQGIPVYANHLKIGIRGKQIASIAYNAQFHYQVQTTDFPTFDFLDVPAGFEAFDILETNPQYFPEGDKLIPAVYYRYLTQKEHTHKEVLYDARGNVLIEHTLDVFYHNCGHNHHENEVESLMQGPDSLVEMFIFNPDPLTEAGVYYGGIYIDGNNQNTSVLNPLRKLVEERVKFSNGTFSLENPNVIIVDFEAPNHPAAYKSQPSFLFSRSHPEFEQVNAYYHITQYKKYLNALNFNQLVNYQIWVDANAMFGQDNSKFNFSANPPRLHFGTGGVADAEDADVIVHEYGHAISYSAAPNTNFGNERRCLDEAFGDYLAARYSKNIKNFRYKDIFTWDGHNEFWPGRMGEAPGKMYDQISFGSNIYAHTNLWVDRLDVLANILGDAYVDEILFESMFGYTGNMTFEDAARLLVSADSTLNNAQNVSLIWNVFYERRILPSHPVGIVEFSSDQLDVTGTYEFAQGGELTIHNKENNTLEIEIYDLTGMMIIKTRMESERDHMQVSSEGLAAGTYLLKIKGEANQTTLKVARF